MYTKVFISYTNSDYLIVHQLANDLKKRGIIVWLDEWEIKVGDEIRQKIEHGIQTYDYFIIILSKKSVNSTWVAKELNAAYMKEIKANRIVILPVLLEECEIPILISGKKYADFEKSYKNGLTELLQVLEPKFTIIQRKTTAKILIVDDDLTFAEAIGITFERLGWSTARTYDMKAAIELAKRYQPVCVLIDIWYVTDSNSYDCISKLRDVSPNTKIFGMSGYSELPEKISKSFDNIFTKPFTIEEIITELNFK